jgi:uncharacterized protein YutE (UPF0331/DUF86 family)
MTLVEKEIIRRKLTVIVENLKTLAEKLAPSAGLRNRLVHEYDLIEHSMVLKAVIMAEELYPEYIKEIEDYLSAEI